MNVRAISFINSVRPLFLAVFTVAIAVLEVVVAVKFQFPVQVKIQDIGLLWLLNLDLPDAVNVFAAWIGATPWIAMDIAFWVEIFRGKPQKLTVAEIIVFTSMAAVPVWGAIVGPFSVSVWLNAGMWVFASINGARVNKDFSLEGGKE